MPTPASSPAGSITVDTQTATLDRNVIGFQPISNTLRIDCAANFGVAAITSTSAPDAFSLTVRVDGRILDFVGRGGDDGIVFLAEHILQPEQIVAAEIVVLRNHREFGIRIL